MDDSLILGGDANRGHGNTLIRTILQVLKDLGIPQEANDSTCLSAAIQGVCCDNEQMFYENEIVVCYL